MFAGQSERSDGEGGLYDAKERRGNFRRKASEWVTVGNPQRISGDLASGEGQGLRAWLQMEMSGRALIVKDEGRPVWCGSQPAVILLPGSDVWRYFW